MTVFLTATALFVVLFNIPVLGRFLFRLSVLFLSAVFLGLLLLILCIG